METSGWRSELSATAEASAAYRTRAMLHLSRMGHCAPTVARTLLDATAADAAWVVRAAAGLPGGIGNTRNECGALTASSCACSAARWPGSRRIAKRSAHPCARSLVANASATL